MAAATESFDWGREDGAERGVPEGSDTLDPATNVRTVMSYSRNAEGKLVRLTRKYQRKERQVRMKKDVHRRRQLPKFGDVAGKPSGREPNISYYEEKEVELSLTGTRKEEKSEVDELLEKIKSVGDKKTKGFLFTQSQKMRTEQSDFKMRSAEQPSIGSGEPDKFVPMAIKVRADNGGEEDLPTLKVSNLPLHAQEKDLYDLFTPFGMVPKANLVRNRLTKESRGYAFVSFTIRENAQSAMDALHRRPYDNLILSVEWAKSMLQYKKEKASGQ